MVLQRAWEQQEEECPRRESKRISWRVTQGTWQRAENDSDASIRIWNASFARVPMHGISRRGRIKAAAFRLHPRSIIAGTRGGKGDKPSSPTVSTTVQGRSYPLARPVPALGRRAIRMLRPQVWLPRTSCFERHAIFTAFKSLFAGVLRLHRWMRA